MFKSLVILKADPLEVVEVKKLIVERLQQVALRKIELWRNYEDLIGQLHLLWLHNMMENIFLLHNDLAKVAHLASRKTL